MTAKSAGTKTIPLDEYQELRKDQLKQIRQGARTFFQRHPMVLLIFLIANYIAATICFNAGNVVFNQALLTAALIAAVFMVMWLILFYIIPNLLIVFVLALSVVTTIAIAVALVRKEGMALIPSVLAAVGVMVLVVIIIIALMRAVRLIPGMVVGAIVFFCLKDSYGLWPSAAAALGAFAIVFILSIFLLRYVLPGVLTYFLAVFSAGLAEKAALAIFGKYSLSNILPENLPPLAGSIGTKIATVGAMISAIGREVLPQDLLLAWASGVGVFLAIVAIYNRIRK